MTSSPMILPSQQESTSSCLVTTSFRRRASATSTLRVCGCSLSWPPAYLASRETGSMVAPPTPNGGSLSRSMAINSPLVNQPSREKSEKNHLFAIASCRRWSDGGDQVAREFAMRDSSSSAVLFLPFGSLTGVIPVDTVSRERIVGDFSSVLTGTGERMSKIQQKIHSVIDPIPDAQSCRRPLHR